MGASNMPEPADGGRWVAAAGADAAAVRGLWNGALGRTVRCVPTRRTVATPAGAGWLFGKWRRGHHASAAAEWHWLHALRQIGLDTAEPVAWIGSRRRSLLVTRGVAGRGADAWAQDALRDGWFDELVRWACRQVAPRVRSLHDRGLFYRDLYWNHVFAEAPRAGTPPTFLDCERVLRVRWGRARWRVKDLAGLLASAPAGLPPRGGLRFARAYFGGRLRRWRRVLQAIVRKAGRIRAHAPRYG